MTTTTQEVEYKGKKHTLEQVVPGVVKKGTAYFVQCCQTGEWCYCSPKRFDSLCEKRGGAEALGRTYISRAGHDAMKAVKEAAEVAASNTAIGLPADADPTVTVPA